VKLILLDGPPGSGKSAEEDLAAYDRVAAYAATRSRATVLRETDAYPALLASLT
jgi:hypothetical protein